MQLEGISVLFSFIGGLGMFLYGMHVMANGLHRIRHFRRCFRHELVALKHGSQRLGLRFSRSEAGG